MEELEISGKRYISTRRAAREHGYHSDYMGQLIRGKKVAGQKVGRAWYIEEESLNAYLGKAPAPAAAQEVAPEATPVEHLIIEEPAPVAAPVAAPEPEHVAEAAAQEPVASEPVPEDPAAPEAVEETEEIKEESHPIEVRIEPQTAEPAYAQPVVQEIHHAPYIEEQETRIPIHTPAPAVRETGGLRYAADDTPSIPVIVRMPQMPVYSPAAHAPAKPASGGKFPFISLSVVGLLAILAASFAANFITASVVSEEGKTATVQYAIHW